MNKRVTFVTPRLHPLGNAGQLPFWCETLAAAGWLVTVVSLQDKPGNQDALRYPGIDLHCLALRPRTWSRWRELQSLIAGLRADVLHLWDCPAGLQWWLGRRAGRLLVTSFSRSEPNLLARWQSGTVAMELVFDPQLAEELGPERAAGSTSLAVRAAATLVPKAIPRTLERRQLTRARLCAELDLPAEAKLIVGAAELAPETHCKDLLWGIDQLKIIRDDTHLLLMGQGRQRRQLERFLSLTEAESRVHFLGDRADGPEIIAAADIFWQADLTRYLPEGLLLALAAGVPVVSAYGPNTSSVVWPQQTAWVADTAARYQYARWSKFFLEEPGRAAELAAQAKQQMLRDFSHGPVKARILDVYAEVGQA